MSEAKAQLESIGANELPSDSLSFTTKEELSNEGSSFVDRALLNDPLANDDEPLVPFERNGNLKTNQDSEAEQNISEASSDSIDEEQNEQSQAQELENVQPTEPESPLALSARQRDKIAVIDTYCSRKCGSDCTRCELVCPKGAISFDEKRIPHIDQDLCSQCGICVGVCDGFSTTRITFEDFAKRVDRLASEFDELYFTCTDHIFPGFEPQENVIVLPCLAALPPELWAYTLTCGKPIYIYCDETYCESCDATDSTGKRLFDYTTAVAQQWCEIAFKQSDQIPEYGNFIGRYMNAPDQLDRRAIFSSTAKEASTIASGNYRERNSSSTNEFMERKERMHAMGYITQNGKVGVSVIQLGKPEPIMQPRLMLLQMMLEKHPALAKNIPHYYVETDNALCNACGKCLEVCQVNARIISEEGYAVTQHDYCTTCSMCIEACPNEACYYIEDDCQKLLPKEN